MITRRRWPTALAVALFASALAACGGGSGVTTLNWYINPDNGGQAELAAKCSAASNGAYRIRTSVLPNDATAQRGAVGPAAGGQGLLHRPDEPRPSVHPGVLDAGFLRPFTAAEAPRVHRGGARRTRRLGHVGRQADGGPVLGQHPVAVVPQVGGEEAGLPATGTLTWERIIEVAGAPRPGRGPGQPLRGLHGVDQRPGLVGRRSDHHATPRGQGRRPRHRLRRRAPGGGGDPAPGPIAGGRTRACRRPTRRRPGPPSRGPGAGSW